MDVSVGKHILETIRLNFTIFLFTLPLAMGRFSFGGVSIYYLFSVLRVMLCFAIMDLRHRMQVGSNFKPTYTVAAAISQHDIQSN